MNVLFATNHAYPPQHVGGSEASTHDLCLTLREIGIEVAVLSSLRHGRQRGRGFRRDEVFGYPVFRAANPAAAATEVVRDVAPDVAVIQAGRPLALAERFTALALPCVVYLRDAQFDTLGRSDVELPGVRYLATSRDLARRFSEAFGILPEQIPPLARPERYRVVSSRQNVTFVCPHPMKGVDIALGLAARRRDIPFVFLESWQLPRVHRLVLNGRVKAAPNITYRGRTGDMRTIYGSAKVVLVPSRWPEAWGRVVSEAQVSGIPALASNHGGLPESVGSGGILVDPDAGLEHWERALARIWDDEAEYDRLAGLAREHAARPDFQPDAIAAKLLAVLESEVGSRHVPKHPHAP
ncbi:MAG: glycosyltransferase [Dehalococcoidia bacterium]